jgi:hypothetical protein
MSAISRAATKPSPTTISPPLRAGGGLERVPRAGPSKKLSAEQQLIGIIAGAPRLAALR